MLKQLQKKYSNDIEVVSISMDEVNASWRQAVRVDQLDWTQLNDPKSVNGGVADSYGVRSLPFNCILDANGKILATKLRGAKLEEFLSSLFDLKTINRPVKKK